MLNNRSIDSFSHSGRQPEKSTRSEDIYFNYGNLTREEFEKLVREHWTGNMKGDNYNEKSGYFYSALIRKAGLGEMNPRQYGKFRGIVDNLVKKYKKEEEIHKKKLVEDASILAEEEAERTGIHPEDYNLN